MIDIRGQDGRRLAKLNDNVAALVMQLERPHQYEDAARIFLRLKELLPNDHELRRDMAIWYRAVAGDSSIVAPLLDEFVNPRGDAVTLAEKFERWERRKLERARVQAMREGKREGKREGVCHTMVTLMQKRFGSIPKDVRQKMDDASDAQMSRWALRLLDAPTLEDVFKRAR